MTRIRLHQLIILVAGLSLTSLSTSVAMSCPEIRKSYELQLSTHKRELARYVNLKSIYDSYSSKAFRDRQQSDLRKELASCQKKPKSQQPEFGCIADWNAKSVRVTNAGKPDATKHIFALDNAQRIVLNNKKCFDPVLVANIQRTRSK